MPFRLSVLVVLALVSGSALARSDEHAALSQSPISTQRPTVADRIGLAIEARTVLADRTAPNPAFDCKDASQVERRVAALQELDAFIRSTATGLVNAAPTLELRALMDERLAPVVSQHRAHMAAALAALRDLPLVRERPALSADVARLTEKATQAY